MEREIVKKIKEYLDSQGIFCWKNHGSVFMPVGIPDLVGVLPISGRLLAIEVKQPGKKPTPAQVAFLEHLRENNACAFIAHSVEEVKNNIDSFT